MNKGRLFIMCGIPGSGKTYFCKNRIKGDHIYVSRDEIRFALLGEDDPYFSKEKEVWKHFVAKIEAGLEKGADVYADATHLNPASRSKLLNCLADVGEVNAIYFDLPIELIKRQNAKRSGRAYVPEEQLESMAKNYQRPEFKEGFDHIWRVTRLDGTEFKITELEED